MHGTATGTLIIGGGQAGAQIAITLRELGYDRPITIVGAEDHAPYQRPPLSKAFLQDDAEPTNLTLRSADYYERADISIIASRRITAVTLADTAGEAEPGRGIAYAQDGFEIGFDQLALTVGARVRRLTIEGAQLEGVCYLRDITDARKLKTNLADARRVVVIGGGFIGLEAASVARGKGKDVTVVEAADRLIARAVAPVVSEFYREAHERRGTVVRLSTSVSGLAGDDGRVSGVCLSDGTVLPADLVVVGIGIEPRTELAESLGLECERGIVVDPFARTSNLNITAAGDCTVFANPLGGDGLIRLESVQNATDQGRCAGTTMAGRLEPNTAIPWFWSNQGDLKLQIAGLSWGYDRVVVRGTPESEKFSVVYFRGATLLAIDAVNRPQDYLAVRRSLAAGQTMIFDKVGQLDIPLKELAIPNPT